MKRYRLVALDFDTRSIILTSKKPDSPNSKANQLLEAAQEKIAAQLLSEYGAANIQTKIQNYIDLGPKSFSVVAYHNRIFDQIRSSYVSSNFYPALTAVCSLGERVLNHLVIDLRDDFKSSPSFKRVYGKDSFDNWDVPISVLTDWNVLLPEARTSFERLKQIRNRAIHFNPSVTADARELALEAISCFDSILKTQFTGWGTAPWLLLDAPGETYIKKVAESLPFVRHVYLPNCVLLSPYHKVKSVMPWEFEDPEMTSDIGCTDEEFVRLRREFQKTRN